MLSSDILHLIVRRIWKPKITKCACTIPSACIVHRDMMHQIDALHLVHGESFIEVLLYVMAPSDMAVLLVHMVRREHWGVVYAMLPWFTRESVQIANVPFCDVIATMQMKAPKKLMKAFVARLDEVCITDPDVIDLITGPLNKQQFPCTWQLPALLKSLSQGKGLFRRKGVISTWIMKMVCAFVFHRTKEADKATAGMLLDFMALFNKWGVEYHHHINRCLPQMMPQSPKTKIQERVKHIFTSVGVCEGTYEKVVINMASGRARSLERLIVMLSKLKLKRTYHHPLIVDLRLCSGRRWVDKHWLQADENRHINQARIKDDGAYWLKVAVAVRNVDESNFYESWRVGLPFLSSVANFLNIEWPEELGPRPDIPFKVGWLIPDLLPDGPMNNGTKKNLEDRREKEAKYIKLALKKAQIAPPPVRPRETPLAKLSKIELSRPAKRFRGSYYDSFY